MANVNIYISDKEEIKLKKLAQAEGKSISAYCREKIAQDEQQEQPLSRVTIESQIEEIEKTISKLENRLTVLSKVMIEQVQLNTNMTYGFFSRVIEDDEVKADIYNMAVEETKEYMGKIFKG